MGSVVLFDGLLGIVCVVELHQSLLHVLAQFVLHNVASGQRTHRGEHLVEVLVGDVLSNVGHLQSLSGCIRLELILD